MLEAEATRLDSTDPAWRFFRTYRLVSAILLAALPAVTIVYFLFFTDLARHAENRAQHAAIAASLVLLSISLSRALYVSKTGPSAGASKGTSNHPIASAELASALASARAANEDLSHQLAASEEARRRFATLFAQTPEAILVVAPDGRILMANQCAAKLFGYTCDELSTLAIESLVPVPYRDNHLEQRAAYQAAPEARVLGRERIIPCQHRDGSTFHVELSLEPLPFDGQACTLTVVRDITESRRSMELLLQSERHFRDIFDHAPIGMAITSPAGHLVEVNDSLCMLLGYSREELHDKGFREITHPDDTANSEEFFRQLIAGEINFYRLEKRYLHKDGTPVWALLSVSLQRNISAQPLHAVAQIIDIGAIRAARDALAESERRLQRVLDGSNDGFWDRHIPTGVTTFSPRWAAMLGYGSEEIAPSVQTWENLVHPDDLPLCRRLLAEHLSGQRDRYEAVYRMRHRGGHWIWILARGKAYEWDEAGKPVRMAGTHTDVTVRQLTVEALRMREQTLKAVLEALPIGIWIGSADGRITSANAAALAMGPGIRYRALTQEGMQAEGWGENGRTVAPHDWALMRAIEKRDKVGEQLVEIEYADGSTRTVLNSGLPILDEHGNPLGAIAVNQDMTKWLKLEQDLVHRTQQLEKSNRELEQFAYVASHDLQEPLRKVSSFAQLFAKKYSDRLDPTGQTYINFMVDGATRMQILVDDLLHYSRLTRGDRPRQQVDMNGIMHGVLADLQVSIREAGAAVRTSPLPVVIGDAGQLRALLQNLVSNAVKYRSPDRLPQVDIDVRREGNFATFSVGDNGIGIDSRYFDRIFVIFQRLHARSEYPGTGIGLAICKKIVDNHGGKIWVESTPEHGATFYFTLPTGEYKA